MAFLPTQRIVILSAVSQTNFKILALLLLNKNKNIPENWIKELVGPFNVSMKTWIGYSETSPNSSDREQSLYYQLFIGNLLNPGTVKFGN